MRHGDRDGLGDPGAGPRRAGHALPRPGRRGRRVTHGVPRPALLTAVIAPSATPALSRDLDGDGRVERLTTVRARLPYFSVPQYGRQWSVRDVVDGRRVARRIGPPFERMHRLRFADRNADGRLEI